MNSMDTMMPGKPKPGEAGIRGVKNLNNPKAENTYVSTG